MIILLIWVITSIGTVAFLLIADEEYSELSPSAKHALCFFVPNVGLHLALRIMFIFERTGTNLKQLN